MIEQRMHNEAYVFLKLKLPAILIFKLLCHHLYVVQHHWKARAGKFKAVTLCYWALLVLDGFDAEGKYVGDCILALCHTFCNFDWRHWKVVVSAAGQISVAEKGDLPFPICIMTDDGKVNSTQNVTWPHLHLSQWHIRRAILNLDQAIEEALTAQQVSERKKKLEEVTSAAYVAALRSQPPPPPLSPQASTSSMPALPSAVAASAAAVAASAAAWPAPPLGPPPPAPPLNEGSFPFGRETGVIIAPLHGTDDGHAPVIIILPPSGGFNLRRQTQGGGLMLPLNCPRPCWYAYMNWHGGGWKLKLPDEVVQFVQFVKTRAKNRALIGWGLSRGAKWVIELVQGHRLLDAAVIFAGYPQTKCEHEQRASAQELINIRNCAIFMVHMVADECCGVPHYPYWHAEFERHMAHQNRQSSLISMILPGNHDAAYDIWLNWKVQALHPRFEVMWERLVLRH